jgi:hypothetical protein
MENMDIFISWSGPRSRAVAEALKEYLPIIVNAFNPWLSSADIDKGSRSSAEIASALANAKAGIICLTPNNLSEPWILFEAGAVAKTVLEKPLACTLLIGLEISDVSGPLAQFQATKPTKAELLHLVKTLNKALGQSALKESQVEDTFQLCWPKLKERLDNLPLDGPTDHPRRSQQEMITELVDLTRRISADVSSSTELFVSLWGETNDHIEKAERNLQIASSRMVSLSDLNPSVATILGGLPEAQAGTGKQGSLRAAARGTAHSRNALRDRVFGVRPEDEKP